MTGYEKLLVAVDLGADGRGITEGSRRALNLALDIAPALDAHVTLLHSSAADEHWETDETGHVYVAEGLADGGIDILEGVVEEFRALNIGVEMLIVEERPWIAVIRHVVENAIDLVLVGKRSAQELGGARIGSVTAKLIHNCPCSVWAAAPGAASHPETILAATDLGSMGARVLHTALQLRRVWSADLHLFHAFQLTMEQHKKGVNDAELQDIAEARRLEMAGHLGENQGTIHTALTSPTRGIQECVKRYDPELVIMGTVSHGGIPGLLLGSTAERLMRSLECSLLVVKPEDFKTPIKLS